MDALVEKIYTPAVPQAAADAFETDFASLKLLGDVENYVYSCEIHGVERILRVSHSSHRTQKQLEGELDFINYLVEHKFPACAPQKSKSNNFIEKIATKNGEFYAIVFEKARGQRVSYTPDTWNERLFFAWGAAIGRLHALSKDYTPRDKKIKRYDYREANLAARAKQVVADSSDRLLSNAFNMQNWMDNLSRDKGSFGLVHTDVHPGNFMVEDFKLQIFDFDDCCYHWYIYDLAMALYYALWSVPKEQIVERQAFVEKFWTELWRGYLSENALDKKWVRYIPKFLEERSILLYVYFGAKQGHAQSDNRYSNLFNFLRSSIYAPEDFDGFFEKF